MQCKMILANKQKLFFTLISWQLFHFIVPDVYESSPNYFFEFCRFCLREILRRRRGRRSRRRRTRPTRPSETIWSTRKLKFSNSWKRRNDSPDFCSFWKYTNNFFLFSLIDYFNFFFQIDQFFSCRNALLGIWMKYLSAMFDLVKLITKVVITTQIFLKNLSINCFQLLYFTSFWLILPCRYDSHFDGKPN